jgi:hypothetical protein
LIPSGADPDKHGSSSFFNPDPNPFPSEKPDPNLFPSEKPYPNPYPSEKPDPHPHHVKYSTVYGSASRFWAILVAVRFALISIPFGDSRFCFDLVATLLPHIFNHGLIA